MSCELIDCPFYAVGNATCGLSHHADRNVSGKSIRGSLVSASLEVGRELAASRMVSFVADGTCMYPCIKHGDTLFIEPCSVNDAKVGDIAVICRSGFLMGHRIISKGIDEFSGTYIVTRSDRNRHGSDGPTYQDEMLGIVSFAERKGNVIQLAPLRLYGVDLLKVSLWEWWHWKAKPEFVRLIFFIQQLWPYRHLATLYLRVLYPDFLTLVYVPLKPMQKTDLFQVFPVAGFDLSAVIQQGRAVAELRLQLEFRKNELAAWVMLIHRPEGCPDGGGWRIERTWCRNRYRGAGLENRLVEEAQKILGRSGESLFYQS